MLFSVYAANFYELTPANRIKLAQLRIAEPASLFARLDEIVGVYTGHSALVQKCNSVHIIVLADATIERQQLDASVFNAWSKLAEVDNRQLRDIICVKRGPQAFQYLLECASGIHSVTVGDQQVFGQFMRGLLESERIQGTSSYLRALRRYIRSSAKLVRENTALHRGSLSLERIACEVIHSLDLSPRHCSVIGLGQSGHLIVHILIKELGYVVCAVNRSAERRQAIEGMLGLTVISFDDLSQLAKSSALIIAVDLRFEDRAIFRSQMRALIANSSINFLKVVVDLSNESVLEPTDWVDEGVMHFDIGYLSQRAQATNLLRVSEARSAAEMIATVCDDYYCRCLSTVK